MAWKQNEKSAGCFNSILQSTSACEISSRRWQMSLSGSRHYLRNNDNLTLVACVYMELTGDLDTLIVTCQFLLFSYRSN